MNYFVLVIFIILSFISNILAATPKCLGDSFHATFIDSNSSCLEIMEEALNSRNCKKEEYTKLKNYSLSGSLLQVKEGSSTYCHLKTDYGIFQVMGSDMAEPPIRTLIYSRLD